MRVLEIDDEEQRSLVVRMARVGVPDFQIAFLICVGVETLRAFMAMPWKRRKSC